ncbi:CCB1 [Symbiodinium pilosum]|uniref:CCB1 protein n=1 Tax=Symbiodinium pilosum TaxID=2952 RepID=A0A812KQ82_SYMPI|nr:CCB1 [Symbiodinium pilosum]
MVYTPSHLELDSQTVATFTYWGLALQFKEGGGSFVFVNFVVTSLVSGLVACFLLALPWLHGLSFGVQHILIRVAIWVGRLPFQESQTLGNAGLSMNADLALPLDAVSQMRMPPLLGPFVAIAAVLLCLGAGVAMVLSLPQRSARTDRPDSKQLALPDLALCSGILTGTFIWLFFAYLSVGFQGLASLVLPPNTYSGMDLGGYSPGLKMILMLQTVIAPVGQAVLVGLRATELVSERWRPLEELFMSLNAIDVFALVFLAAFLDNVDGFTTSFVSANFADVVENTEHFLGMAAVGVDAAVVEMGLPFSNLLSALRVMALTPRKFYTYQLVAAHQDGEMLKMRLWRLSCSELSKNLWGQAVAEVPGYLAPPPSGVPGLEPSQLSLGTAFALFVVAIPGVLGTIQRSGQAKFVEKTYVMPGTAAGGLEMRSIAGGIVAYFTGLNYMMEESPQQGRIRFVGQLQGSISQALFLTFCLGGAIFAVALLLVQIFPDGPFGVGPDWWFTPMVISPSAGLYYWQRAFRKDIVELQLGMTDDFMQTSLVILGSLETIEELQNGVRFQPVAQSASFLNDLRQALQDLALESLKQCFVVPWLPILPPHLCP